MGYVQHADAGTPRGYEVGAPFRITSGRATTVPYANGVASTAGLRRPKWLQAEELAAVHATSAARRLHAETITFWVSEQDRRRRSRAYSRPIRFRPLVLFRNSELADAASVA